MSEHIHLYLRSCEKNVEFFMCIAVTAGVMEIAMAVSVFWGYILSLLFLLFASTASTLLRKDTGVFEFLGRFIRLKCHNYALYLCFVY